MSKKFLSRWLPPLLWMGIIFLGSSLSNPTNLFLHLIHQSTITPTPTAGQPAISNDNFHDVGHAAEYIVLAFLLQRALYAENHLHTMYFAWGGSMLYAFSDEFHQLFVHGRTFQFADLGLDALGALLGVLLYHGWVAWRASHPPA